MKDPIKLVKIGWRTGLTSLVVISLFLGGLALNLSSVFATSPNLTINYLVANNGIGTFGDNVTVNAGETITLYAGIHNTNVPTTAENIKFQANLPSTSGTSTATVSADNHGPVSDSVQITVNGGVLEYVAGSAQMTWDEDGDGTKEYNGTTISDDIVGGGLVLGNQQGCNAYVIQISFQARVVEEVEPSPSPTPSPTPEPSPTPTPPVCTDCGGDQDQEQEQEQDQDQNVEVNVEQNNNQTVNITAPPAVAGVKIPVKQPETGVSVLGLAGMAGAAPLGLALTRFGKGRVIGKKEESLNEFVNGIVNKRGKSSNE